MNADAGIGPAVFAHNDLGLHNTLVKDSEVAAIVDWEMANVAHPAQDLGSMKQAIDHLTDWDSFAAAYRARGGPAEACELSAVNFYQILIWTRNSLLATYCDHLVISGATSDMVMTHAALDYHQRNSRVLALALAAVSRPSQLAGSRSPPGDQAKQRASRPRRHDRLENPVELVVENPVGGQAF